MKNYLLYILLIPLHLSAQSNQQPDWLIDNSSYKTECLKVDDQIILTNGLIKRVFKLSPNAATIAIDNLMTGEAILRGVKPEAEVTIDGDTFNIGGLTGQSNYAFLLPDEIKTLQNDPAAFQFTGHEITTTKAPFNWKKSSSSRCIKHLASSR